MEGDWRVRKSSLGESLGHIFSTGFYSDVAFLVGEEEFRINAHKTILSARSEPLAAMFHERWTSAKEQEIRMPQNNPPAVKHFLKFLYTDAISFETLGSDDILEITHLAHMYQVHKLLDQCIAHLNANIDEKTCLQIHKSCQLLDKTLSDKALEFFLANVVKIAKTNNAYLTWDYETIGKLLKEDREYIPEPILFKALLKWSNVDSGRNEGFQNLSKLIRFPTMSAKDFASQVVTSGVLPDKEIVEVFSYMATQTGSVQFPSKRRKLHESAPKHLKICGSPVAVDVNSFQRIIHNQRTFSFTFYDHGRFAGAEIKLYGLKFFSYGAHNEDLMAFLLSRCFKIKVAVGNVRANGVGGKVIEESISVLSRFQMLAYFDSPLVITRNETYSVTTSLISGTGIGAGPNNEAVRFELPQLLSPCHQQGLGLEDGKLTIDCFEGFYSLIDEFFFSPPGATADCSECKIS